MNSPRPIPAELSDAIARAADLILGADALVIAAGAGMGVDSNLPDFRGPEGFWQAYPALRESGLDFYGIASPATFYADPTLAWGFYGHRLDLYRRTVPHAGFDILKRWGRQMEHGFSVFISNVDGQFQKAGVAPEAVHECHGSIHYLQCLDACTSQIWTAQDFAPVVDTRTCRLLNEPPLCENCGGMARPNILMFGDSGWLAQRAAQQSHAQTLWLNRVRRPVVIELGAGAAIPTVRQFSNYVVLHAGGRLIRINTRESAVRSPQDVGIAAGALQGLRWLDQTLMALGRHWWSDHDSELHG